MVVANWNFTKAKPQFQLPRAMWTRGGVGRAGGRNETTKRLGGPHGTMRKPFQFLNM